MAPAVHRWPSPLPAGSPRFPSAAVQTRRRTRPRRERFCLASVVLASHDVAFRVEVVVGRLALVAGVAWALAADER